MRVRNLYIELNKDPSNIELQNELEFLVRLIQSQIDKKVPLSNILADTEGFVGYYIDFNFIVVYLDLLNRHMPNFEFLSMLRSLDDLQIFTWKDGFLDVIPDWQSVMHSHPLLEDYNTALTRFVCGLSEGNASAITTDTSAFSIEAPAGDTASYWPFFKKLIVISFFGLYLTKVILEYLWSKSKTSSPSITPQINEGNTPKKDDDTLSSSFESFSMDLEVLFHCIIPYCTILCLYLIIIKYNSFFKKK